MVHEYCGFVVNVCMHLGTFSHMVIIIYCTEAAHRIIKAHKIVQLAEEPKINLSDKQLSVC